eukprot:4589927-Prymnesium_polylepis.1
MSAGKSATCPEIVVDETVAARAEGKGRNLDRKWTLCVQSVHFCKSGRCACRICGLCARTSIASDRIP